MKRPNVTLAIAAVLCIVTATIGFGGDYIKDLFRSGGTAQALAVPPSTEAPPAAPAPDPQRDESQITVFVTDTGERYHRGDCRYLSRSKHAISLKEAKRQGYTPCKVCKPAR
ncbi:MAG: hypothetical protein JOZ96_11675 [Acidobacteria bacterium]|nr:hypothetical protein [Acidobacteriota bacterium]